MDHKWDISHGASEQMLEIWLPAMHSLRCLHVICSLNLSFTHNHYDISSSIATTTPVFSVHRASF